MNDYKPEPEEMVAIFRVLEKADELKEKLMGMQPQKKEKKKPKKNKKK